MSLNVHAIPCEHRCHVVSGRSIGMEVLSVVVPCYNEESTLADCVSRLVSLRSDTLAIEIIIVDDCSSDDSLAVATALSRQYNDVLVARHTVNQGKGAALSTGFGIASGQYIAIQDADLEYEPLDLLKLVDLLRRDVADVAYGSRFLSGGEHRVLYFWHSLGNRFLTLLSNMMTDLNLTDMETCYKVFKRDVIKQFTIEEKRFGFEPEITAKVAQSRCRVYEMGISYHGRTYDEGKKIGWRDGVRAIYCIIKYNAFCAPAPIQFLVYFFIGAVCALFNLGVFLLAHSQGLPLVLSAPLAFVLAAILNYRLCLMLLFKHKPQWSGATEMWVYALVVVSVAAVDLGATHAAIQLGVSAVAAKLLASALAFVLNFLARRHVVFRLVRPGKWRPANAGSNADAKSENFGSTLG